MPEHNDYIKLIHILEKEKDVYAELLSVIREKQDNIVKGDVAALRSLINQEKKVITKSSEVAVERVNFINHFCQKNDIKGNNIPLKDFAGFSPEPEKHKIENIRYELKNILSEIQSVNRQNETLLHFSINHIQKMTNIFLHTNQEEMNMYSINGKKYMKESKQKFVNQQI